MRNGFSYDHIILVVQGKDNICDVLEMLNGGIIWEESIPNEEEKVQYGKVLDCTGISWALGLITRHEEEVEEKLDQVGDMTGFGVSGGCRHGHNGLDNSKGV